jgi:putative spermidine/putrescine transport system permease protein
MTQSHELNKQFLAIWSWSTVIFLLAPLLFVVAVSLTSRDFISLPTEGVSLRWYAQMLTRGEFLTAGFNSVFTAIQAAATALLLGVPAALAVVRYRFPFRTTVRIVATSPLFIPMTMSGLAILIFSSTIGWSNQQGRIYVAHCALTLPYVFRTVSASLSGFDLNQELAARNLGASPLKAFMLVTLPQIRPGLMAGAIFAFIVSFDNIGMSIFLTGSQYTTLPVQLFTYASYSDDPMTAAVSVAMIVLSLAAVGTVERFFGLQKLMRS